MALNTYAVKEVVPIFSKRWPIKQSKIKSTYKTHLFILLLTNIIFSNIAIAEDQGIALNSQQVVTNVIAEGQCAVIGVSAEQSQLVALQRARATAIEQAAGVSVTSSTLVTNFSVTADFIKTYAKGLIVSEKIHWLPLGQYQRDPSMAPIPEYRVKIQASVYIPQIKIKPLGLKASLNQRIFKSGEKASVYIKIGKQAEIAIFNIMANDQVVMIYPNNYENNIIASANESIKIPTPGTKFDFVLSTLPGHERDAEAVYIIAKDMEYNLHFDNIFKPLTPMSLSDFFEKYARIADYCEDMILPYEVVANK